MVLGKQFEGCKEKAPGAVTERIWWGKQHLAQTDRQEVALSELPPIQIVLNAGPEERKG